MKGFLRCFPAALLAFSASTYAHDIISAGPDMMPLDPSPITDVDGSAYVPLAVSGGGRYVLFANYDPASISVFNFNADECRIYRKDRITGDLLTVFDSSAGTRKYCNGARMSADGNIVATSPTSVPSNPGGEVVTRDGENFFSFGDVVALTVKDIAADSETDILTEYLVNTPPVLIPLPEFGGYPIQQLNAHGNAAIITVANISGNTVVAVPGLVDIETETVDTELISFIDPGDASPFLTGAALNADGSYLALSVTLSTSVPNPDPPPPLWIGPWETLETENAIFRVNRNTDTVIKALLPDEPELIQGLITAGRTIRAGGLSDSGNTISWIEAPPMCIPGGGFGGLFESCAPDLPLRACEDEECEPTIRRYSFSNLLLNTQQPTTRTETKAGSVQDVRFSSDTLWMLFSRKIVNPFGDDYEIPESAGIPPDGYICINRASVDSGSGVPVQEACAVTNPGPIPPPGAPVLGTDFTELTSPKIWVLRNLQTGVELSVSTHDNGFQADRALISDDAATVVYESRDPRLRHDDLTGTHFVDESLLDDACFWPDGPGELNIRVITNDNTRFFTAATQYIYEFMSVFCPAPTPALDANIFASEVLVRVPEIVPVRSGGSAPGPWLLALLVWYGVTRYLRRAH